MKVAELVLANKTRLGRKDALSLARAARKVVAAKGKKITELEPSAASDKEILAVMLGPTGNLRAPVLRVGKTLYVGFPKEGFDGLG